MSRIEEALKRASTTQAGEFDSSHRDRFMVAAKTRVRVDDFVPEHQNAPTGRDAATDADDGSLAVSPSATRPVSVNPTGVTLKFSESVEGKLVSLRGTDPTSVEQYRRLAATLHELQQQNGIKLLMVTSSVPREGKTLTSANLALTLSQSYKKRVLLIDADLRRPFVHEIFGIDNQVGLGDGLQKDGASLPLAQVAPNLSVLPAGRPNPDPMAGLASDRMRAVLKDGAARHDWVIVDSPPVGLLSDASLIASFVDGVLFVIAAGGTNYQVVERALNAIGRERVIGIVLNRTESDATAAYGYYEYYQDDSLDRKK